MDQLTDPPSTRLNAQWHLHWVAFLLAAVLGLGLVACAKEDEKLLPTYLTEGTEVNVTVVGDVYEVTIVDFAGTDVILGDEGADAGLARVNSYTRSAVAAKRGKWIVLPIRIKNISGEEQLLFSRVMKLVDDQGNEFILSDRLVHTSYVFFTDPETYGHNDNLISQRVFDIDEERLGPAIFDVAEDSTGLMLHVEGSEQSLATGY
jgi:hypothetical protein